MGILACDCGRGGSFVRLDRLVARQGMEGIWFFRKIGNSTLVASARRTWLAAENSNGGGALRTWRVEPVAFEISVLEFL